MTLPRLAIMALALLGGAAGASSLGKEEFDHAKHARLFPTCQGCHAGISDAAQPVWPTAQSCASCHDGTVEKKVEYAPPTSSPASNLRFTHAKHLEASGTKLPADSTILCQSCHIPAEGKWMAVERTVSADCRSCHQLPTDHFAAADTACATCHVALAEAKGLSRDQIAHFGKPANHDDPDFLTKRGHGEQAKAPAGGSWAVSPSCATCHARDFCAQCHVNAPEVRLIQALAPDPRSTAIKAELKAPVTHEAGNFMASHGGGARRDPATCAACHTQQSCVSCHRAQPSVAMALPAASPARGLGAQIERKRPASHVRDWADNHGQDASAAPKTCAACHARSECLDCHRPAPGATGSYHPAGFLVRHPSAAFNRQSDCASCHNQASFCAACHEQSGLAGNGRTLSGGYHDSRGAFLLNHGTAARLNLESCITCHTERDCLACHSAQTRRFNPHGPGFDPERLRKKNPQTCAACHGNNIPKD